MSDPANVGQEQAMPDGLETLEDTLSDQQKEVYSLLTSLLSGSETDEGSLNYLFAGLEDVLEDLRETLVDALPGSSLLEGVGGGAAAALGGGVSSSSGALSKLVKVPPQLHPKPENLMQLPVEYSMGYLLIYDQLVKMAGESDAAKSGKKKKEGTGAGIGGFFSNLLKGAEGLALIAVGLIAFAGAMLLFQFIQWEPAMTGLIAFGVFVVGMTIIAKKLGDNMASFLQFAQGILLMTAGIILFNIAVWISAQTLPYLIPALATIVAYGIFVNSMVEIANKVSKEMGSFIQFAAGTLLLTGGILLFNLAIFTSAAVLPYIPRALLALGMFIAFVGIMAGLALLVGSLGPAFLAFAGGTLLMISGLLLFGVAIMLFAAILPIIPRAREGLNQSLQILVDMGQLAVASAGALLGATALSIALVAISAGFILWGVTLTVLGLVAGLVPRAKIGIRASIDTLNTIALMGARSAVAMAVAIAFSVGIAVISAAFILWGAALLVLGTVSKHVPAARIGVLASIQILKDIAKLSWKVVPAMAAAVVFSAGVLAVSTAFLAFGLMIKQLAYMDNEVTAAKGSVNKVGGVIHTLTDVLGRFSTKNISEFNHGIDIMKSGLQKLTSEEKDTNKLAKSLERISKAIQVPDKTIWDVIPTTMTGGTVSSTQNTGGTGTAVNTGGPSVAEKLLTEIKEQLADWHQYIVTIANKETASPANTVVVSSSLGGVVADSPASITRALKP